mgnify:CR=1 FL=1
MSNGSLAELPPDNIPDSINLPDDASVMLLLPHNKYLLGTGQDHWVYGRPGTQAQSVYLYDGERLSLFNEGAQPTILSAETVRTLRRKLFMHSEPPGRHSATVLMLRTMMRDNPVFSSDNADFLDEKIFARFMSEDDVLERAYWTLRFGLARGEMEIPVRLKAWLKTGPEVFCYPKYSAKIWFSILDLPEHDALAELEELSFSESELRRLAAQNISPIVLYNSISGWLVLGQFGRGRNIMFSVWLYMNHELWQELRERRKLSLNEIINAAWGEYDTRQAMSEREKYRGDDVSG